jgi:hypothetical protein
MSKSWRDYARPIIYQVLTETAGKPEKEIKAALRDAYPFGERAMHPYKVWCDEIKRQRGLKKPTKHQAIALGIADPNQKSLFT